MFYKLPKNLFCDKEYGELSVQAAVVYAVLVDRLKLSIETNRVDDRGEPYIFFSRKEMARVLRISERSVVRYMGNLKALGLISFGSKEGCTSPPIYVKDVLEKKNKKPATNMWQEKSYDDDEIRQALIRQFVEE